MGWLGQRIPKMALVSLMPARGVIFSRKEPSRRLSIIAVVEHHAD